jgi:hypothetical protein
LLQKAMCVLYMVLEVCDTVTKAAWSAHKYKRYKWQLNKEAAWLRGIYMESEAVDLTSNTKREARI